MTDAIIDPFVGPFAKAEVLDPVMHRYRAPSGEFQLPIAYESARSVVVVVPAPLEALQAVLPSEVRARRLRGDEGAMIMQFVDLPNTSLGPYRECIVGVMAQHKEWPDAEFEFRSPPCYALWVPVTSPLARDAGHAIWQYPKEVTEIDVSFVDGGPFHAHVRSPSGGALECSGMAPRALEKTTISMRVLTGRGASLVRSVSLGNACMGQLDGAETKLTVNVTPGGPFTDWMARIPLRVEDATVTAFVEHSFVLPRPLEEV